MFEYYGLPNPDAIIHGHKTGAGADRLKYNEVLIEKRNGFPGPQVIGVYYHVPNQQCDAATLVKMQNGMDSAKKFANAKGLPVVALIDPECY